MPESLRTLPWSMGAARKPAWGGEVQVYQADKHHAWDIGLQQGVCNIRAMHVPWGIGFDMVWSAATLWAVGWAICFRGVCAMSVQGTYTELVCGGWSLGIYSHKLPTTLWDISHSPRCMLNTLKMCPWKHGGSGRSAKGSPDLQADKRPMRATVGLKASAEHMRYLCNVRTENNRSWSRWYSQAGAL